METEIIIDIEKVNKALTSSKHLNENFNGLTSAINGLNLGSYKGLSATVVQYVNSTTSQKAGNPFEESISKLESLKKQIESFDITAKEYFDLLDEEYNETEFGDISIKYLDNATGYKNELVEVLESGIKVFRTINEDNMVVGTYYVSKDYVNNGETNLMVVLGGAGQLFYENPEKEHIVMSGDETYIRNGSVELPKNSVVSFPRVAHGGYGDHVSNENFKKDGEEALNYIKSMVTNMNIDENKISLQTYSNSCWMVPYMLAKEKEYFSVVTLRGKPLSSFIAGGNFNPFGTTKPGTNIFNDYAGAVVFIDESKSNLFNAASYGDNTLPDNFIRCYDGGIGHAYLPSRLCSSEYYAFATSMDKRNEYSFKEHNISLANSVPSTPAGKTQSGEQWHTLISKQTSIKRTTQQI